MNRVFFYAVIAAVVVVGAVFSAGPIRRRFNELRSDQALISGDTGDIMSGAAYQRYQASRQALAAMREDLYRLAQVESTFIADFGRPTTNVPGYRSQGRGNIGPTIEIKQDRWIGTMTNAHTTAQCQVIGMLDTAGRQRGSAQVYCVGTAAVESAWAAAQREEASRPVPPAPVAPEPDQPSAPPAPPAPPTPRRHRDWGPVNNTPPPMPYVVKGACEGEGCTTRGLWAACSTVVARSAKRPDAPQVFTVAPGERFTAQTIDIHVEAPGMVVFRHDAVTPSGLEGGEIDSIVFTPADTLYLLNESGEGYLTWWFRGQAAPGYQFWRDVDEDRIAKYPQDSVVRVREARTVHWVQARNTAGREGWIEFNYYKMATGGYMDEVERCLLTTRDP